MRILAIDPGSSQSAWVTVENDRVGEFGIEPNDQLLAELRLARDNASSLTSEVTVIEWTAPRGMPASAELFETMWWAGQFAEALAPRDVRRLNRMDVKRHLCGTSAARDSNVHAALVDRFGGAGREGRVLVDAFPDGVSRTELGERTEISPASGTFRSYLSKLRVNRLLDETNGTVRAGEALFMGSGRG